MNREIFPGGTYPLQGDVTSQAGQSTVTVSGIQNRPVISTAPTDQQRLVYIASAGQWQPTTDSNQSVQVNGVKVSDDYTITVNTPKQVLVNGV